MLCSSTDAVVALGGVCLWGVNITYHYIIHNFSCDSWLWKFQDKKIWPADINHAGCDILYLC